MIPSIGPIRWLVVYVGGALIGATMAANTVKYTARSFFTSRFRGTRKISSSSSHGRPLEPPS